MPFRERFVNRGAWVQPSLLVLGAAALTALLFVVVTSFVARISDARRQFRKNDRAPKAYESYLEYAMRYALESSEANDAIFLGDSTCLTGINPITFQKRTGLRAYNLGTVGVVGIDGFAVLLQAYLQHHPTPRVVALSVHPSSLGVPSAAVGPIDVRERFLWSYGPPNQKEPSSYAGIMNRVSRGAKYLYGEAKGGLARYADDPLPDLDRMTFNSLGREIARQRGHWETHGVLDPNARRPIRHPDDPFPLLREHEEAIGILAALCERSGITLLLRLTPALRSRTLENYDPVRSWSRELEAEYPGLVVSRPEILEYEPSWFGEEKHCNGRGAEEFTLFAADEVMHLLADANRTRAPSAKGDARER